MTPDISQIDIHGRPFNGNLLTATWLENAGLGPVTAVDVGGREIWLSPLFTTARKRNGCIAYVSDNERYIARTFFLSRSQGVWRLLRRYRFVVSDDGSELPNWHDKGFNEDSLLVPLAIQKSMAGLDQLPDSQKNLEFAFYGTTYSVDRTDEYDQLINPNPVEIEDNYSMAKDTKSPPESLTFISSDQAPDFSAPILEWQQRTDMYGDVTNRVFASRDRSLAFLFIKTNDGRAWIGGVEAMSEVCSLGIRKNWVRARDFTTPPYEYLAKWDEETGVFKIDQTGGYGNAENRYGHYVDMTKNYLSKIPVLIEFASQY